MIEIHETTARPMRLSAGTLDSSADSPVEPTTDAVETVRRILGYDPEEQALLAEGYLTIARDSAEWANLTFSAQIETLPEQ
jgi:hypothetical protein